MNNLDGSKRKKKVVETLYQESFSQEKHRKSLFMISKYLLYAYT